MRRNPILPRPDAHCRLRCNRRQNEQVSQQMIVFCIYSSNLNKKENASFFTRKENSLNHAILRE